MNLWQVEHSIRWGHGVIIVLASSKDHAEAIAKANVEQGSTVWDAYPLSIPEQDGVVASFFYED